jgi:hypothetical protein
MFLGGWALMIAVGMLPGTLPITRLVALTRGVPDAAVFVAGRRALRERRGHDV